MDKFSTPYRYETESYYNRNDDWYYRTTSDYYYRNNNYYDITTSEYPTTTTTTTTTTTEAPKTDLMPASCCAKDSNYVNLECEKAHTSGCFEPIHQVVSESIMMIGSSALVFAVIQV